MPTRYVKVRPASVLVIDPPTREFVRAVAAHDKGASDPIDFDALKGGIDAEVRHIMPKMAVLVEIIMTCYEDRVTDRSRISYILRQRFGFFPSAKAMSKAINRVKVLRSSQIIIPVVHLTKLDPTHD